MKIKISLCNSAGELDSRIVTVAPANEDTPANGIIAAVLDLLDETAYLSLGDSIVVTEAEG